MRNKNRGFIEMEIVFWVVTALFIIGFIVVMFIKLWYPITSATNGSQKGYITAVEKSGMIFPTYSAYIKTDLSSSQEDKYCVESEEIVNKLKQAQENKTSVVIEYKNDNFVSLTRCSVKDESIIINLK